MHWIEDGTSQACEAKRRSIHGRLELSGQDGLTGVNCEYTGQMTRFYPKLSEYLVRDVLPRILRSV